MGVYLILIYNKQQYNSGVGFSRSRFCDGDLSWNGNIRCLCTMLCSLTP